MEVTNNELIEEAEDEYAPEEKTFDFMEELKNRHCWHQGTEEEKEV